MQTVHKSDGKIKQFAPTSSIQMRVSPIALGISSIDLHGLTKIETAFRLRQAAEQLVHVAITLECAP